MDAMVDYDIIGEIFTPIEKESNPQYTLSYDELIHSNYGNYRNVFFQGELTKMFIVLRSDKNINNIRELFNNLYIKIDFEPFGSNNNPESKGEEEYEKTLTDIFSIDSTKFCKSNYDHDMISMRTHYEEHNTTIFQVYKHIIVPPNLINAELLMRVNLMVKNDISFAEEMKPMEYFQNGYYNTLKKYKKIKTLFKEAKIIRPLIIKETKQIDVELDTALLQAKLENTTTSINFVDHSLIKSRFLTKVENDTENSIVRTGMNININEVEILKDETTFDERNTKHVNKKPFIKNDKVCLAGINFAMFNTTFPIVIRPGEEYNLTIKVIKSAFLSEKNDKETVPLLEKESIFADTNSNQGSSLNKNPYLMTQPSKDKSFTASIASVFQNNFKDFSITQIQKNVLNTQTTTQLKEGILNTQQSKFDEESSSKYTLIDNENYRICFITPIILSLSANLFYDNPFLCIPIKWSNEINRFLKVEMTLPSAIFLHEYFEINLKCLNLSASEMNLCIEISDTIDEINENNPDYNTNNNNIGDRIPSIISQTKFQNLGLFNCNEDKVFIMKFLPLKNGFHQIPSFTFTDALSKKKFIVASPNKIFVNERNNKQLN